MNLTKAAREKRFWKTGRPTPSRPCTCKTVLAQSMPNVVIPITPSSLKWWTHVITTMPKSDGWVHSIRISGTNSRAIESPHLAWSATNMR